MKSPQPQDDNIFSRLRPFIADSEDDGPDTVLVIKGFSCRAEIEAFMDAMLVSGVMRPKQEMKQ